MATRAKRPKTPEGYKLPLKRRDQIIGFLSDHESYSSRDGYFPLAWDVKDHGGGGVKHDLRDVESVAAALLTTGKEFTRRKARPGYPAGTFRQGDHMIHDHNSDTLALAEYVKAQTRADSIQWPSADQTDLMEAILIAAIGHGECTDETIQAALDGNHGNHSLDRKFSQIWDWARDDAAENLNGSDCYNSLWDGEFKDIAPVRWGFHGRGGGHLCLEQFNGMHLDWSKDHLSREDWEETNSYFWRDMAWSDLWTLYRFVVQCDWDFRPGSATREINYQMGFMLVNHILEDKVFPWLTAKLQTGIAGDGI